MYSMAIGVVDDFPGDRDLVAVVTQVGQRCTAHPDAVDTSLGQGLLCLGFNQLIFYRGTAAVQDEDIHMRLPSSLYLKNPSPTFLPSFRSRTMRRSSGQGR